MTENKCGLLGEEYKGVPIKCYHADTQKMIKTCKECPWLNEKKDGGIRTSDDTFIKLCFILLCLILIALVAILLTSLPEIV